MSDTVVRDKGSLSLTTWYYSTGQETFSNSLNCDADTSSDVLIDTQQEKTLFCNLLEKERR